MDSGIVTHRLAARLDLTVLCALISRTPLNSNGCPRQPGLTVH